MLTELLDEPEPPVAQLLYWMVTACSGCFPINSMAVHDEHHIQVRSKLHEVIHHLPIRTGLKICHGVN